MQPDRDSESTSTKSYWAWSQINRLRPWTNNTIHSTKLVSKTIPFDIIDCLFSFVRIITLIVWSWRRHVPSFRKKYCFGHKCCFYYFPVASQEFFFTTLRNLLDKPRPRPSSLLPPCVSYPGAYVHALVFIAHRVDNSYVRQGLFMFADLSSRAESGGNGRCRRGLGACGGVMFYRLDYSTPRKIPTRRHQCNCGQKLAYHDSSCKCRELVCRSWFREWGGDRRRYS